MTEVTVLVLYGLLVVLTLILQATGTLTQMGIGYLISSRDAVHTPSGVSARLNRALDNSITAMVLFAPAVLLITVTESSSNETLLAAQVFLIARIVYLPAYALGIIGIRSLAWMAGMVSTVALYLLAL